MILWLFIISESVHAFCDPAFVLLIYNIFIFNHIKYFFQHCFHIAPNEPSSQGIKSSTDSHEQGAAGASAAVRDEQKVLTAADYRTAIMNVEQGTLTTQDAYALTSMLRSADTNMLSDGLKLAIKVSVSSQESRVRCPTQLMVLN